MLQHLASLESITRSLIATVVLLFGVMLIAGGLGVSGPAILTFSIWISLIGLLAVGVFLIARAQRPYFDGVSPVTHGCRGPSSCGEPRTAPPVCGHASPSWRELPKCNL